MTLASRGSPMFPLVVHQAYSPSIWRVWRGGEWMRGLGLDFTNSVGTGGVLDVCLCFGCGGMGGVGGEWVGGLDQGLEGWCYVCVRCESGFSV